MRGILELLRWSMINDKRKQTSGHHRPYLARWLQGTTPELPDNFFEIRAAKERQADLDEVLVWEQS